MNPKKQSTFSIVMKTIGVTLGAIIVIAFIIVLPFFFTHNNQAKKIVGSSMMPGIADGQYCFATNTPVYERGNIVLAHNPTGEDIIKRVIGIGGDKIGFFLDDSNNYKILLIQKDAEPQLLEENYLENPSVNQATYTAFINNENLTLEDYNYNNQTVKMLTLTDTQVFWLGDNRENSYDCADYGPQDASKIYGRVDLVVNETDVFIWKILLYQLGL